MTDDALSPDRRAGEPTFGRDGRRPGGLGAESLCSTRVCACCPAGRGTRICDDSAEEGQP